MAHESFEDEATARVMNELFVNIKVDREERPDIDQIYQVAHQLIAGRPGGWPLGPPREASPAWDAAPTPTRRLGASPGNWITTTRWRVS